MKRLSILLLAAAAAATSCTSPNKKQPPTFAWDKAVSFANVKTFAWYDGGRVESLGRLSRGRPLVDVTFAGRRSGVTRKGYRKARAERPTSTSPPDERRRL
jgi:hypothetical protein